MILKGSYKQLDSGLHAAVIPYDNSNPLHRVVFGDALHDISSHVAMVHKSDFNEKGFNKVRQALDSGDIKARFFVVADELCNHPIIVGGELHILSLAMKRDGRKLIVKDAELTEDFSLLPSALREVIERSKGKSLVTTGLAAFFNQECIELMAREGKAERHGEFVLRNTKMTRILSQSGTELGIDPHSGVFSLNGFTPAMRNRWLPDINIDQIAFNINGSDLCNKRLMASWLDHSGAQLVAMSFTKSISTFSGEPVIQARFVDTADNLPPVSALKDILTSLATGGHEIVSLLKWDIEPTKPQASPIIPFNGSRTEIISALMSAGGDEIVTPRPNRSFVFGGMPLETHFSVLKQPKIRAALEELGLKERTLGKDATKPGRLHIVDKQASRPLFLVRQGSIEEPRLAYAA